MSATGNGDDDLDATIQGHLSRISDLLEQVRFRSALDAAGEVARLGKREGRLIPHMLGLFHAMDLSKDVLEPEKSREFAVQLIALLEDPERARSVQGDFPEEEYLNAVATMTTCAYDNLAEATARLEGYNSAGMQQCLAEGIQICHRTGRPACVNCFRNYAAEVHTAADDIPLAVHHATMILNHQGEWSGRGDCRPDAAMSLARLHLLLGDLGAADRFLAAADEASRGEEVVMKLQATIRLDTDREALALLADESPPAAPAGRPLPAGENPVFDLHWALCDALRHCRNSDYAAAKDVLTHWDRLLTERACLSDWFEVRLRLIAAHRLAGDERRVETLSNQLQAKAKKAGDYLTLRRLRRLIDPTEPVCPVPLLAAPRVGPYAPAGVAVPDGVPADGPTVPDPAAGESDAAPSPKADVFRGYLERLQASADGGERPVILGELLAMSPDGFTHPDDAGWALQLVLLLLDDGAPLEPIWAWAETLAARFPQTSFVVSLQAAVADVLRAIDGDTFGGRIPDDRVDALFRRSLELEPEGPNTYVRAGTYFLGQGELGDAERCLARGFRLDRLNGHAAVSLANVYRQTDRARDALAVLDLCLREGSDDPSVAWEAALAAYHADQFESLLTYLDRHDALLPDQPWAGYYRAMGLLELGRPAEAVDALGVEADRNPDSEFGVEVLRACAAAALGQPDAFRAHAEAVLAVRWSTIDTFTRAGVKNLAGRLWKAAAVLPPGDPLVPRLEERLTLTGLAPEPMFAARIEDGDEADPVKHYRCQLLQPLDERWAGSDGCLNGQADWPGYHCLWGVLAYDEDEAADLALEEQAKCYPLGAAVEEVRDVGQTFTNKPGVLWQGERWDSSEDED